MSARSRRLHNHLASGGADAKRNPSRDESSESWFPYYAGFPASFAAGVFNAAQFTKREVVLDPWNGSGTTTEAALRLSVRAVGVDINPVANLVSSARLASAADASHITGLVDDLFNYSAVEAKSKTHASDPLLNWLSPTATRFARAFQRRVVHLLATTESRLEPDPLQDPLPPLAALLLLAMSRAIRTVAPPKTSSNPTWLRPNDGSGVRLSTLTRVCRMHLTKMVQLLGVHRANQASVTVLQGDSRAIPLEDNSIAFVLTSPPYLTRMDYVISTKIELALLGKPDPQIEDLRRTLMGTPLTRSKTRSNPSASWSSDVRGLLDQIAAHKADDSFSYYYKTFWQYFDDAHRSMAEIARVLVPGGFALLVAQNSYYKDIELDLPDLLKSMGRLHGLTSCLRIDTPVTRALTSINSRSQAYRPKRRYVEAALLLRRS